MIDFDRKATDMNPAAMTNLEGVDVTFGNLMTQAFENLAQEGTEAFIRFIKRPSTDKVIRIDGEDPAYVLAKIGAKNGTVDLPIVAYYRDLGIVGDDNQQTVALDTHRMATLKSTNKGIWMQLSTVPLTLTYQVVFAAWDRPTLERVMLAWFCYIMKRYREKSRFFTPYIVDGACVEIPASIVAPRQILATDSSLTESGAQRLWAGRTAVEVSTQVLYGRHAIKLDPKVIYNFGFMRCRKYG